MIFLPFEDLTYSTPLKGEALYSRLTEYIEPVKSIRFIKFHIPKTQKPFHGIFNHAAFDIRRVIHFGNSSLTKIRGTMEPDFQGTIIKVKLRLPSSALIFLVIWFVLLGFACAVMLVEYAHKRVFEPAMLIPFGMLLIGYLIVVGGFNYESYKTKKDLEEILQATIIKKS